MYLSLFSFAFDRELVKDLCFRYFCLFHWHSARLMANQRCWLLQWMNKWLWCIEDQRCKRAWLDGKIHSPVLRTSKSVSSLGRVAETKAEAQPWGIVCVMCHAEEFGLYLLGSWERMKQFYQHSDIDLSFFQTFYYGSFQPYIIVERVWGHVHKRGWLS